MKELDPVVLTEALPRFHLEAGDLGYVVMVHEGGAAYEVEFMALDGETVAVCTVPAASLRPVAPREIAHVRHVA